MYIYYVYAYLRSKDSKGGKAGTPYYIGKGKGFRAYARHGINLPKDKSRIVFLERNLTNVGALAIERRMIQWYGRKDLGTGILLNMTDGGDGGIGKKIWNLGIPMEQEHKDKISVANKGRKRSDSTRAQMAESHKGMRVWNAGIKTGPLPVVVCPHCSKLGGRALMTRWHFDNCRLRT